MLGVIQGDTYTTEIRTYTQLPPTFITSFTNLCKENKHLSAKLISYSKDNQTIEQKELSGIYTKDVQWDSQLCAADITFIMNCLKEETMDKTLVDNIIDSNRVKRKLDFAMLHSREAICFFKQLKNSLPFLLEKYKDTNEQIYLDSIYSLLTEFSHHTEILSDNLSFLKAYIEGDTDKLPKQPTYSYVDYEGIKHYQD